MRYVNDIRTPSLDPDPVNLNPGPQLCLNLYQRYYKIFDLYNIQSLIRDVFNLGILSVQEVLAHFIE